MHFLKNDQYEMVVLWSARSACTTVKNWFYFYGKDSDSDRFTIGDKTHDLPGLGIHKVLHHMSPDCDSVDAALALPYKKAWVIRNPVDRFVSMLGHPAMDLLGVAKGNVDGLLDVLETRGTVVDQHFMPQTYMPDRRGYITPELMSDVSMVRCESDICTQLNSIFPLGHRLTAYNVTRGDVPKLTTQQEARVRDLYKTDFDLLGY